MRNVQIIDGAINSEYAIFAFSDTLFSTVFPAPRQDIEFSEDVFDRLGPVAFEEAFKDAWTHPIKKPDVKGIHGTLFYQLSHKKTVYPNKSEQDVSGPPHSSAMSVVGFKDPDGSMKHVQVIDGATNCTY